MDNGNVKQFIASWEVELSAVIDCHQIVIIARIVDDVRNRGVLVSHNIDVRPPKNIQNVVASLHLGKWECCDCVTVA